MRREGRPPRVLIVEDEFLIALNLQQMLEDIGVEEVDCAQDLETAADFVRRTPPDFAILDINIGPALVFPIAAELHQRGVPFVFSSGRTWGNLPEQFARHPLVPKPLEPKALNSILGSMGFGGGAASQQHAD
jgi:two-component SAPR family response regulator